MNTSIKEIPLVCPYCPQHPQAIPAPSGNGAVLCPQCGRQYPLWEGKPCFIDRPASGLKGTWIHSHERLKNLSWLEKLYFALTPPKIAPRRRFSHKTLLLELLGRESQPRALYVGYNNAFEGIDTSGIVQIDVVPKRYVDIVAMGENLPFPDGSFDLVVISNVIEHVIQPFSVVSEAHRVLKEGGTLYCSSPWIYPFHGGDNYRFSFEGLGILLKDFSSVEIGSADGPLHALAVFFHYYVINCPDFKNKYVKAGLNLVVGWLLLPLKLLDAYTNRRHKSKYLLDANIYALGRK